MYKICYPQKDATIEEKYPDRNSGIDQIIFLTKYAPGETRNDVISEFSTWDTIYNSRILIKFDINDLKTKYLSLENTGSFKCMLNMTACEEFQLPLEYSLVAHPVSVDWKNGNGNANDLPYITNGASWNYMTDGVTEDKWNTGSGAVVEYVSAEGGGSWYNEHASTQSFIFESADISMDVTNIVKLWMDDTINNNGFIIKHTKENEENTNILGSIKFFGRESHTIHLPKLVSTWNNVEYTGSYFSGSNIITDVTEQYFISITNLKTRYTVGEQQRLRIVAKPKFVHRRYDFSLRDEIKYRLPQETYYSIIDTVSKQTIVPYCEGTLIETDNNGHYINIDLDSFLPNRYYTILFKVVTGAYENIINDKFNFNVSI